tara:strand:+ start:1525 stop:1755 length:231 start_codon:yes stop_codon:yes gene_type:complete
MAHFTSTYDIKNMGIATEVAKGFGVKAYGFYATNFPSVWVISGVCGKRGSEYFMVDTINGTIKIASGEEFRHWVQQ